MGGALPPQKCESRARLGPDAYLLCPPGAQAVAGFFFARVFRIVAPQPPQVAPWPGAFLAPRTRARAIIRSAPRTSFRWSHFLPPTCRIPLLSGFRRGMHVMTAPRAS